MFIYTLAIKSVNSSHIGQFVCVQLLSVARLLLWTMYQLPTTSSITGKRPPLTSNYLDNTSFWAHQWHGSVCDTDMCVSGATLLLFIFFFLEALKEKRPEITAHLFFSWTMCVKSCMSQTSGSGCDHSIAAGQIFLNLAVTLICLEPLALCCAWYAHITTTHTSISGSVLYWACDTTS